jgi:uncharacterized membrane protein
MAPESRSGRSPLLLTRVAMFVAVGIVLGLALSAIPNVELVTATCFVAGFLLGPSAGLLVGGLTEALFAGFNPLGSSFGILLVSQVLGMALAGAMGALAAWLIGRRYDRVRYPITIVSVGVLATFLFDVLTNLAFPLTAGFSVSMLMVSLVAAIPFSGIHILSNALVFLLIVTPLLPRLEKALTLP